MKRDSLIILVLIVLTCLSRIPFATRYIVTHDSVGFALALKDFDITKHQPYPPGYILYVGLAKFINLFIKDANTSYIILNILFSSLAITFIYLLGKEILNPRCGLISALFLFSSPVFWAYGELALCYIVDAFGATIIAYISYKVINRKKRYVSLLSIMLGIIAGIRVYLLPFLLPLWVRAISSLKSRKGVITQILILVIVCLSWFIPLIMLSGGFTTFMKALQHYKSAIFPQFTSLKTVVYTVASSLWGLGAVILALVMSANKISIIPHKKELLSFLMIWCGPIVLFAFIFFIGNPGQVLFFLPAFILFSSIFAYNQWTTKKFIFTSIIIFANLFLFFTASPLLPDEQLLGINTTKFRNFANFWMLDYSNKGLRKQEKSEKILKVINENFSPKTTVIAIPAPDLRAFQPYIPWRVAYYYLPNFWLLKIQNTSQVIELPPNINTIIWLMDKSDLEMKSLQTQGKEIYFSNIKDTLKMENLLFVKKGAILQE